MRIKDGENVGEGSNAVNEETSVYDKRKKIMMINIYSKKILKLKKVIKILDSKFKQLEVQLINISKQMSMEKESRITLEMESKSKILELEFELKNCKSNFIYVEKGWNDLINQKSEHIEHLEEELYKKEDKIKQQQEKIHEANKINFEHLAYVNNNIKYIKINDIGKNKDEMNKNYVLMKNLSSNLSEIKQNLKNTISNDNFEKNLNNSQKISSNMSDSEDKFELMKKIQEKTEEIIKKDKTIYEMTINNERFSSKNKILLTNEKLLQIQ
jgi:hypothetical protein